jgi:hypothetical protein
MQYVPHFAKEHFMRCYIKHVQEARKVLGKRFAGDSGEITVSLFKTVLKFGARLDFLP